MASGKEYQKLLRQRRKLFDKDWNCLDWDALEKLDKEINAEKDRQNHNMNLFLQCVDGDNFDSARFAAGRQ